MKTYLGGLDFGPGGDDLALTDSLALCGHGQRLLQFLAEDNILDQHALDLHTPASRDILDDLPNALRDLFTALDDVLQDARTNDMAQGRLGTLDQRLAHIADAECRLVRARNVVVDDAGQVQRDIVLGHTDLARNFDNLDLDVDLDQAFGEGIDLDETRVDGARKSSKASDETDIALVDGLVRVRADDTAGNRTEGADAASEGVD